MVVGLVVSGCYFNVQVLLLPDDLKTLRVCKEQGLDISVMGDSMDRLMMEYV